MDHRSIISCQFGQWYPSFRDIAFRSKVIELPAAFVKYLVDDGVFLAADSNALPRPAEPSPYDVYSDWSEDDAEEAGQQDEAANMPEFPELLAAIEAAIDDLGGCVAPKLNWSAPHDAAWVSSCKSLACRNADEVLLLLKSSDRIAHDICHAFDACTEAPAEPPEFHLALRKWIPLRPEREFRCFVKGHDLAAISQRNIMENAAALEAQKDDLLEAMLEFFEEHVQRRFPEADYTFDVYITTAGAVRLMDFNPIGGTTSPLLFDWAELPYTLLNTGGAVMRPSVAVYGAPFDMVDNSEGSAISELLRRLQTEEVD
ncbi:hypothetical protein WJX75_005749 [Coccomyxa subellipsoidea]|uniref:Cell division cycle protein 123 n=1 Tax=Coccomyxa subellipsoidea TaxID=248742 RepID=A0ABR2YID1_9CHLO